MSEFIDYPMEKILQQKKILQDLLKNPRMKDHPKVVAWSNWCDSYEYRKKEWEWRQQYRQHLT